MADLTYATLKDAWRDNRELCKYHFILDAWINSDDQVEYGLLHDRATTERVLKVMAEHGYRCSIVERLLGEMK
jgi:hypothetical protein